MSLKGSVNVGVETVTIEKRKYININDLLFFLLDTQSQATSTEVKEILGLIVEQLKKVNNGG